MLDKSDGEITRSFQRRDRRFAVQDATGFGTRLTCKEEAGKMAGLNTIVLDP